MRGGHVVLDERLAVGLEGRRDEADREGVQPHVQPEVPQLRGAHLGPAAHARVANRTLKYMYANVSQDHSSQAKASFAGTLKDQMYQGSVSLMVSLHVVTVLSLTCFVKDCHHSPGAEGLS